MAGSAGGETLFAQTWLRSLLVGDATLQALMGGTVRAYRGTAPSGTAYPFISYHFQGGGQDTHGLGPTLILANPLITVKVVGRGGADALLPIVKRIQALLQGATFQSAGGTVYTCYRTTEIDYEEIAGTDRFQHVGGVYRMQVQTT